MRSLFKVAPLLALIIAAGCTIYSITPYCTTSKIVELKEVNGHWKLNIAAGEDVARNDITFWEIMDGVLITYDKNDKKSEFNIVFFKLKNQLFADIIGKSSQNNDYWNMTVLPMHVLLKVELSGENLAFIPLKPEWFNKPDNAEVKSLKRVDYEGNGNMKIYTSSPEEWERFLEKNLDNPELFNEKQKFVLKIVAAALAENTNR